MFSNCQSNIFCFETSPPLPKKKKEIYKDSLLVGLSSVRPSPRNCFSATEWNLLWILRVQQWKLNSLWLPWVTSMRIHPCSAELDPKQTLWQPLPLTKYDLNTAPLWLVDHHSPTWAPVPEHFWVMETLLTFCSVVRLKVNLSLNLLCTLLWVSYVTCLPMFFFCKSWYNPLPLMGRLSISLQEWQFVFSSAADKSLVFLLW